MDCLRYTIQVGSKAKEELGCICLVPECGGVDGGVAVGVQGVGFRFGIEQIAVCRGFVPRSRNTGWIRVCWCLLWLSITEGRRECCYVSRWPVVDFLRQCPGK